MLRDEDLSSFLHAFSKSDDPTVSAAEPSEALNAEGGLYPTEVWRLGCSLQIAAILGDAPQDSAFAAQLILNRISEIRCAPLTNQDAWVRALAWARGQPKFGTVESREVPQGREREAIVGNSCLRLRRQGYEITVGAYGPNLTDKSRAEIERKAGGLVSLLGGYQTASRILQYLRQAKRHHDGMWLFGATGLGLYEQKRAMLPVGWLFSLALRFLGSSGAARKPELAWQTLVNLATDSMAIHDCQCYSQFENINPHPSQFHEILARSTLWRGFFEFPQVPPNTLPGILDALRNVLTRDDAEKLGFSIDDLIAEVKQLVDWSAEDQITVFEREGIERALPLLNRLTGGVVKRVKGERNDEGIQSTRSQDDILLFACGRDKALLMPSAYLAASACEFIFPLIWTKLHRKRAENVVGATLERAIADACLGKAPRLLARHEYYVNKSRYEFDVATRDGDQIVLIETKSKTLTQKSRSGDMFSFFRDYSDSFLKMLSQLVGHEIRLRQGLTPLTSPGEATTDLKPLKIAVSPLSYGPVSEKHLSNNVLRSLAGARLLLISPDTANQSVIDEFNKRIESVFADIALVAPKKDGVAELFPYLIDVFWLDLGQLL